MSPRWHVETWRKVYVHKSAGWLRMSLSARGLGRELLTYVDDRGFLDTGGEDLADAVSRILGARRSEHDRVAADLAELLADGYLMEQPGGVIIRSFADAQDRTPGAKRTAEWRARKEASHETSHVMHARRVGDVSGVTACDSVPLRSEPSRAEPRGAGEATAPPEPAAPDPSPPEGTPPAPPVSRKRTKPPKPDMSPETEAAWSAYLDGAKRAGKARLRTEASTKRIERALATYGPELVTAACAGIWRDDFARRTGKDDLEWTLREPNIQRHADLGRKLAPIARVVPLPRPGDPDPIEAMMAARRERMAQSTG